MKIILFCSTLLACLSHTACHAQAPVAACPPLMEQAPPTAPGGSQWLGMIYKGNGESRLESIMVFDGHPSELGSLRPDQGKPVNREMTSTWHLDQPEPGRSLWLACTYSNSNGIFARPLAPTIRECRLTQRVLASGRVAEMMSFSCS